MGGGCKGTREGVGGMGGGCYKGTRVGGGCYKGTREGVGGMGWGCYKGTRGVGGMGGDCNKETQSFFPCNGSHWYPYHLNVI